MQKRSYYIINGITLYRVIAAPFLLLLIFFDRPDIFKWLLGVSFFTDAIDGYLARRYKVVSAFGSRLDSIGDDLTVAVGTVGLIAFKTEFIKQEIYLLIGLVVLFIVQMSLAFARYGKFSSFHTYGAKIAAVLQGSFLILMFFLPEPFYLLFYVALIVTALELIEEIILVLMLPEWTTDVRGIYWVLKKRHKATGT